MCLLLASTYKCIFLLSVQHILLCTVSSIFMHVDISFSSPNTSLLSLPTLRMFPGTLGLGVCSHKCHKCEKAGIFTAWWIHLYTHMSWQRCVKTRGTPTLIYSSIFIANTSYNNLFSLHSQHLSSNIRNNPTESELVSVIYMYINPW